MPGAFARSLREGADVKCLLNHDPNKILGRTKSKTLLLADGLDGLHFACQLDRTNTDHVNTYAAIKRGDLSECSFAFLVPDGGDTWEDSDHSDPKVFAIRTLRDVDLVDVSAVAYPAYSQGTAVGARAKIAADLRQKDRLEDSIRKHKCEVLGKQISEADQRALTAENVSSIVREHMTGVLSNTLAGMKHRYVTHNDNFAYSLPEDMDLDPDDENSCRLAKWQYYINPESGDVELKAVRYDAENNPEGPDSDLELNARPIRNEIRDNAILKRRMRGAAGIFHRR
jgi:HK97 family phage prohead protease